MNVRSLLFGTPEMSRTASIGLLVLRLGFFLLLAFAHGLDKVQDPSGIIQGAAGLGFPAPTFFGWAAALAEFAGGILLAIGLLTRPAALIVGFNMLVAFAGAHGMALTGEGSGEGAFVYLVVAVVLLITGPGRFSVDARIAPTAGAGRYQSA